MTLAGSRNKTRVEASKWQMGFPPIHVRSEAWLADKMRAFASILQTSCVSAVRTVNHSKIEFKLESRCQVNVSDFCYGLMGVGASIVGKGKCNRLSFDAIQG